MKAKLSMSTSVPAAAAAGRVKITPRAAMAKARHKSKRHTRAGFALIKLRTLISFCEVGLASGKRCIGDREVSLAAPDLDACYPQQSAQLLGRHQHRSGRSGGSGRGLREGGRHRGMEDDIAFDFLHQLVDMAIEHRDRAEPFEQSERLGRILGAPAPFRIDGPERNMREDDDRG